MANLYATLHVFRIQQSKIGYDDGGRWVKLVEYTGRVCLLLNGLQFVSMEGALFKRRKKNYSSILFVECYDISIDKLEVGGN